MSEFVELHTLAEINPETLPASTPREHRFRYIDLASVSNGVIDWAKTASYQFAEAPSRARRQVRPGDVLFGTVRPTLRSHAQFPGHEEPCVASTGFAVVRNREAASDPRFLAHFLLSELANTQVRRREVGSNYPAVTEHDVAEIRVPNFSLEKQHRIADVLDTVDEDIDTTRHLLEKQRQIRDGLVSDLLSGSVGTGAS